MLPGRILTADALLIGSCGRTDLPNGNAVRQYHTLYYTYRALPDDLLVYPGHDYNGREHSILKEEKESNPKMLFDTEEEFVKYMERENPAQTHARLPSGRRTQGKHGLSQIADDGFLLGWSGLC